MKFNGMSFNALPPIDLPFRFFITAPVFVIICALLVFFAGEALWLSRWQPGMLALTHGFTLGFITMAMMGALLQLLPVIGGVGIAKPRLIVLVSHPALVLGTFCLMANFIWPSTLLTAITLLLLVSGLGVYIVAIALVLLKRLSQGDSIIGFRLYIVDCSSEITPTIKNIGSVKCSLICFKCFNEHSYFLLCHEISWFILCSRCISCWHDYL